MELHVPHYYDKFVCIADKCIDNCCFGGWEINIDEETVHYYQSLNSPFGKEIIDNLNESDIKGKINVTIPMNIVLN